MPSSISGPLVAIAAELRDENSLVSEHVIEPDDSGALGALVAAGPAAANPAAYAEVVELVREGYLLHYGESRLLAGIDSDLALLAGDYLYAKGLRRLALSGDLAAVAELSALISTSARLDAAGASTDAAATAWLASALALAAGEGPSGRGEARAALEAGDPAPLIAWTTVAAERAGLGDRLRSAAEAVGFRAFDRG